MSNVTDGVREVSPTQATLLAARGLVADLARDQVIVHVGKPVGSITGWVGTFFWQVWIDRADPAGAVRARIGEGESGVWDMGPDRDDAALLDAAKDRIIAETEALRMARLGEAQARLDAVAA